MSVQQTQLSNGFRIVTEHMPGLKSASIGIWVDAGTRHEAAAQNGIAHFLEHMAFKGTKSRNALQIAETIEDVGGYLNAYTSRETTAYYARVLEADVPLALELLADILRDSVFEPSEIEIERGVILQEIGQVQDTPDDIIFDWLQEVAYPDQPFGRSILGPAERVRTFARQDFVDFTGSFYGPEQMILSAAGSVDHDQIVKQAEALFADMAKGRSSPTERAQFQGGERREIKPLEQAHLTLALETPGYRDPDIYAAQIFATAFGGGMSSRLFQEAREKRGLCYSIHSHVAAHDETGLLTIYSGTGEESIHDLTLLSISELKRAAEDMSTTEIERARAQLKAGLLMGLESPGARAERMARMVGVWGRVIPLEETVERIDAVTHLKARDFAGGLCVAKQPALAVYGPVASTPDFEKLAEALAA